MQTISSGCTRGAPAPIVGVAIDIAIVNVVIGLSGIEIESISTWTAVVANERAIAAVGKARNITWTNGIFGVAVHALVVHGVKDIKDALQGTSLYHWKEEVRTSE